MDGTRHGSDFLSRVYALRTFIVTFEDRPDEIRKLRRMGYRKTDLPGMFVLLTHKSAAERVAGQIARNNGT